MFSVSHAAAATGLVALLYGFAAYSVRSRWNDKPPVNPLKIIADVTGRASLSNAQLFFFSLVVAWIALYWVLRDGVLTAFDDSVLGLLGIAAGGAAGGKIAEATRNRVSAENWAWARNKKWIERDFTRAPRGRVPRFADLFTTDQGFEVARFQAVAFSLVIGISLLVQGATGSVDDTEKIKIDGAYLGLIGISQGVYVGGKVVWPTLISEINAQIDKLRQLELAFLTAVAKSSEWTAATAAKRTVELAAKAAPAEYNAYIAAATRTAEMVRESTGGRVITPDMIEPALP